MAYKTPKVSYENFCRAFAGVFKKHAYEQATYHTCYIREALLQYVDELPERRALLMEKPSHEELVGYRLAVALLRCGWPKPAIIGFVQRQQDYVDAMVDTEYGFLGVLNAAGYCNDASFLRSTNGARHSWLLDGAPDLQRVINELDESNSDDGHWE